jgi:alkylated DNA repair dioxygenase AlkB
LSAAQIAGATILAAVRETAASLPDGFAYQPDFLARDEERALIHELQSLEFKNFDFHGFEGKRRVLFYGWRYEFGPGGLQKADEIPAFLLPLRERAADFAALPPAALQHVLLTEYPPGAPIGWHRDKAVFGDVIGISLASSCTLRFRRKCGARWERVSLTVEPRSAYLLRGLARSVWEHSIPPVQSRRYSITFRSLDVARMSRARRRQLV